jgi:hypothetical protein
MSHFLDTLPNMVVEEQVTRLVRAFPGKHPSLEGFTVELRAQTEGWSAAELAAAVAAAIRSERHFPRISVLLKLRPEQARQEREEAPSAVCHWCRVEPFTAGYETADGRVFGRTRCNCGGREPGWHTPRAKAWKDARDAAAA